MVVHITDHNRGFRCGAGQWSNGSLAFQWPWTLVDDWRNPVSSSRLREELEMDSDPRRLPTGESVCSHCVTAVERLLAIYEENERRVLDIETDHSVFDGSPSPAKMTKEWRERILDDPKTQFNLQAFKDQWPSHRDDLKTRIATAKDYAALKSVLFEASLGPMLASVPRLEVYPTFDQPGTPDYVLKWRSESNAVQNLGLEAKRLQHTGERLAAPPAQDELLHEIYDLPGNGWQAHIETSGAPLVKYLKRGAKKTILAQIQNWIASLDTAYYPGLHTGFSQSASYDEREFAPQALVRIGDGLRIHLTFYPSHDPESRLFISDSGDGLVWTPDHRYGDIVRRAARQHKSWEYIVVAIGELGRPAEHKVRSDLYGEICVHNFWDFSKGNHQMGTEYGYHEWIDSENAVWQHPKPPRPIAVLSCFDANDWSAGKPIIWCPPHSDVVRLGPLVQNDVLEPRFIHYSWQSLHVAGYSYSSRPS